MEALMKLCLVFVLALTFGGCAGSDFDLGKLESCAECISGLQDFNNAMSMSEQMQPMLEAAQVNDIKVVE
jgi:hypothetical protein